MDNLQLSLLIELAKNQPEWEKKYGKRTLQQVLNDEPENVTLLGVHGSYTNRIAKVGKKTPTKHPKCQRVRKVVLPTDSQEWKDLQEGKYRTSAQAYNAWLEHNKKNVTFEANGKTVTFNANTKKPLATSVAQAKKVDAKITQKESAQKKSAQKKSATVKKVTAKKETAEKSAKIITKKFPSKRMLGFYCVQKWIDGKCISQTYVAK